MVRFNLLAAACVVTVGVADITGCRSRSETTGKHADVAKAGGSVPKESFNVVNGTLDTQNRYVDSVFSLATPNGAIWDVATGFAAIRQRRCLVTAAHVYGMLAQKFGSTRVMRVDHSIDIERPFLEQSLADAASLWIEKGITGGAPLARRASADVAVLWLTDFKSARPQFITRYSPFSLAANGKAAIPASFTAVGYGNPDEYPGRALRKRSFVTIDPYAYVSPIVALGDSFYSSKDVLEGSLYEDKDVFGSGHTTKGDSGGPILQGDVAYGVISADTGWIFGGGKDVYLFAGTDDYPHPNSNYKWLMTNADYVCAKRLYVLPADGIGTITGTAARPRSNTDIRTNGKINMDVTDPDSDSVEYIHEGMSASFSVTAKPGYNFSHWTGPRTTAVDGTVIKGCPCDGRVDPVCTISFDEIGYYSATVSDDFARCSAFMVQANGGGGSGGGPSEGTTSGGTGGTTTGGMTDPGTSMTP